MRSESWQQSFISVIVPAHNAAATLPACIRSVLAADWARLEVIIVDDASDDQTPQLAAALAASDPRVRVIRIERCCGPATARNRGARAARGDLYFFLDSDTELEPAALGRFAAAMDCEAAVVGVYASEPLNRGMVPRYKALLNHYMFSRRGVYECESFNAAVGGIRADVFVSLGGFDERIAWGMDYEHEEFADRLRRQHRLLLHPGIVARHEFPGFLTQTVLYFRRVSHWMERFPAHGFESSGTATRGVGLATAAASGALLLAPLWPVMPPLALVSGALGIAWLAGYAGFFGYVARRRPAMLVPALALNLYFSTTISCGAAYGLLRKLVKPRVSPPRTERHSRGAV